MLSKRWIRLLCIVSVISANKLSLQELTQLIKIKLLISRFPEIFASCTQFSGGKMPVFTPCGRPCAAALRWKQRYKSVKSRVIILLLLHYIYNPFNNLFYIDYAHCIRHSSDQAVADLALGSQVWLFLYKAIHTGTLFTLTAMYTSNLWMHCYRFTRPSFHTVLNYVTFRCQQSLYRCITYQGVCVQQQHAAKRLIATWRLK